MTHVVATISGHGFGHLSISAPVLNRIYQEIPDLSLTIISGLSRERLHTRIHVPFAYQHSLTDSGVAMDPGLSVRVVETATAYRLLHQHWEQHIRDYACKLGELGCDLVLSNVSCLSLAAARHLGIPAIAICSLNWADIFAYYCHEFQGFERIHDQMLMAYNSADVFLKPTPCMPMNGLTNTRLLGPIAAFGVDRKHDIHHRLGVDPSCKLVLVAMGGHDMKLSVDWPARTDIHWLVSRRWSVTHPSTAAFEDLGLPFLDLLASCDLLIGKPGYGTFTEAACAGKPVLYLSRADWPEERYLIDWLRQHGRCKQIAPERLRGGDFIDDALSLLDNGPVSCRPEASGVSETAGVIRQLL